MTLTGLQGFSQSFYPTYGFSLSMETEAMDNMILTLRGPSGASGTIKFANGKIHDTSGNFFGSYISGAPLDFDIAYNSGRYSTWIGGDLHSANRMLYTGQTQYLTGLYMSGERDIDMSLSFYGTRPSLYFSPLSTTDNINFTGFVRITGFSGSLSYIDPHNASGFLLSSNPFTSGNYYISGLNFTSGSTINTDFHFDFGVHNEDLTIESSNAYTTSGYINFSSVDSVTGSYLGNYVHYQDLITTSVWPVNSSFETYLQFIERTGYTTMSGSGLGTGTYSGFVSGSGWITGLSLSGYAYTGYYRQGDTIQTELIPGGFMITGSGQIFKYATGQVVYNYKVLAYSLAYDVSPNFFGESLDSLGNYYRAFAYITGSVTGMVGESNTGTYIFNVPVTGFPVYNASAGTLFTGWFVMPDFPYTGVGGNSGYYDFTLNPGSRIIDNDVLYTGVLVATGHAQQTFSGYLGTGQITGSAPYNMYSTSTGLMSGFNILTGQSHLFTGTNAYVMSNFYNYRTNGWLNNGYIRKSSLDSISGGVYTIGTKVTYDRLGPAGTTSFVRLHAYNTGGGSFASGYADLSFEAL